MKKKVYAIIIILILIVVSLVGFMFLRNVQTYTFKEDAIYYANGTGYTISEGKRAVLDNDENITINCGHLNEGEDDMIITPSSLPIYFKDRDAVIYMKKEQYVRFDESQNLEISKINLFTEIELAEQKTVKFSRNNDSQIEKHGFIYDGNDTYFFLDDMTITIGEDLYTVSRMSYAIVYMNNWVQLYNYDVDYYEYIQIKEDQVIATADDESYSIYLESDIVSYGYGLQKNEKMLQSSAEIYDEYF